MKILHLVASPYWSGPLENVALLALEQRRLGHHATVAVDRRRRTVTAEELAAPALSDLGLLDEGRLELSVKSRPWALISDVLRLRARAVEVIHSHFSHDHFLAALGRPKNAVLIRSIHAPRSLRRFLPRCDGLTVPPGMLGMVKTRVPAIELPPLLNPNYLPVEQRSAAQNLLGIQGNLVIGMISTFQPERRHALGLEAFARLLRHKPEAKLLLAGDGKLEPVLRAKVHELGLEGAVSFLGYLKDRAFIQALQAMDEVWVLGLGNDYSGRAALQARACGARVLAVDEGGLSLFADELVTPDADSIVQSSLSQRRRDIVLPSVQGIAEQVLDLYQRAGQRR